MTPKQISDLRALREGSRVTDAFLTSLARHYRQAEADGVRNPARHFAEYLAVQPQTVDTWLRMARRRGLTSKEAD
jgi:hypothetical protein